jgi:hypothetical protein
MGEPVDVGGCRPEIAWPRLEYSDDPEMYTTAFHEACTWGHTEILKRLRPDPTRDDLGKFLEETAFFARKETMAYLLSLGANPNNKPGGGSNALEACIRDPVGRTLTGSCIATAPTTRLVGLLMNHKACDDALVHEFLRPPRMQQHLAGCERQMARFGLTLDGRRKAELTQTRVQRPSAYVLASYDRGKLYKEVWTEPTQKVAARYGISDVALAKARLPSRPGGPYCSLHLRDVRQRDAPLRQAVRRPGASERADVG